jgi:hypothetical protein
VTWRGRNWLIVVAALFACGLIANVRQGGENVVVNAVIQIAIIGLTLWTFWFLRREEAVRDHLLAFLNDNIEAVRAGTAEYRGQRLSYASRVYSFPIVMSFLVVTFSLQSRLVIGDESARGLRFGSAFITVLLGPWGIPWGPIRTVRALITIARAPRGTNIGELLEGVSVAQLPMAAARVV